MTAPNAALLPDNPLSKIPTLVLDDGSALYDSAVICEYLDSLHDGPKLFPADAKARWTALRRHALGSGLLDLLVLWRDERGRPQPSQPHLDAYALKYTAAQDALEKEAPALAVTPFRHRPYRHRMRALVRGFSLLPSRLAHGASADCGVARVFFTAAFGARDRGHGGLITSPRVRAIHNICTAENRANRPAA
jgi:glutathione S-transferase